MPQKLARQRMRDIGVRVRQALQVQCSTQGRLGTLFHYT